MHCLVSVRKMKVTEIKRVIDTKMGTDYCICRLFSDNKQNLGNVS